MAKIGDTMPCHECGGEMRYEVRDDPVKYKGHTRPNKTKGWWCTTCDEAIFEGKQLLSRERALIELRAEVEQVLLPEQVKAIREKLGISQREAGKVLGGGVRAFQKYESGATPVSEPMKNLLVLLGNDPSRLSEISVSADRVERPTKHEKATARERERIAESARQVRERRASGLIAGATRSAPQSSPRSAPIRPAAKGHSNTAKV